MPEVAAAAIVFLIPVISKLDNRAFDGAVADRLGALGRREENQRETALFVFHTPDFHQSELVAVEIQRSVQIGDAHHGVEISHFVVL